MAKTNTDRKVNRIVKKINKQLKEDVFGDRFWFRQISKAKGEGDMQYYLYEMRDREEPNRNSIVTKGWIWGDSMFFAADLYEEMNDFIVKSSFWSKHDNHPEHYNFDADVYAHEFYHYHSANI